MGDAQMTTDDSGGYKFDGLRAGTYSVEISGFEAGEVSFSSTSGAATVGVGETKVVTFDGTYVRTAGVQGQVSVDGEGLEGVTVTLKGDDVDRTEITNAAGQYAFSMLKSGTYQVGIINPDPEDYEFETTSKTATIATGETANVPFEGTLLRTAGIAGRVSLDDGMGLDGVTVTLAGAAESTTETSNGGQYSFAGLAAGAYIVSISNPDANAYNFADDELQKTVELMDDQSAIVNFSGTHTRTASVSGMLFIDEVVQDKMYTAGEPSITEAIAPLVAAGALDPAVVAGLLAKAKVKLRGPDLNTMQDIDIQADGSFSTGESLMAGTYQVELPVNDDDVAAGLAAAGVAFVGESMVVEVGAGGMATANFPFRITMQTVATGARMGAGDALGITVPGVKLALYARADGTGMLGEATTNEMGVASFTFARDDNIGPAGNDNIVFVRAMVDHPALEVSGNEYVEIAYAPVSRLYVANADMEFATLANVMANFQFWVKSDKDARSGDMPLAGWHTQVYMGDPTADDAMPLMKPDPEDATKMVNLADPTESGEGEDGGELGRAMVSYKVTQADLPATFTVMVSPDNDDWAQPMAMGETWEEVGDDRLMHTHTGLELPPLNTHEANDLMATYVTFKTQKLTVGVYREADDEPGFSDFQSRVAEGDHRPAEDVDAELRVSVMIEAAGRRGLEVYDEWDHDGDDETPAVDATLALSGGLATFANLPADMDFTVQFDEGSDRVAVGGPDSRSDRVQAYGDDLELGSRSVGAFGDDSGAGPVVELCPLTTDMRPSSLGDDDSDCATFAYQWTTGTVNGALNKAVKDLAVEVSAITDVHSVAPRASKTSAKGTFSYAGVQDGVYTITVDSSNDYKVTPEKGVRVNVYHDEFTDDKDDDTKYVGTAGSDDADFSATRLRLAIKGYAANISHETNDVVRGDETYEGAMLELYAYDAKSEADIMKKGAVLATAEVGADGLYAFDGLDEGVYTIVAKNTDDYEMLTNGPDVYYKNGIPAQTYGDPGEQDLTLPYWDYANSVGKQLISTHKLDPTDSKSPSYTFRNFVLLHGDGEFAGRVIEARGEPEGIAVELRRCETFDGEDCREETAFDEQTTDAGGNGRWNFPGLREGNYVVNIAATTYNRAKWGANGIDDDAVACDGSSTAQAGCDADRTEDMFGKLEGKSAFNRGGATFYVYNRSLDDDSDATAVGVKGTMDIDDGEVALPGPTNLGNGDTNASLATITYESGSIKIKPTMSRRATFEAEVMAGGKSISRASGDGSKDVSLALAANATSTATGAVAGADLVNTVNVRVVAENAYHDTEFSFDVTRANPVDARLEGLVFGLRRTQTNGADNFNFDPAEDEQVAYVPVGTGAGDDMSLYIRATGKALQGAIEVSHNGTVIDAMAPQSNQHALVSDYGITIPKTGDLQGEVVDITVTSEDGKDFNYEISLLRGDAPGNNDATGSPAIDDTSPQVGQTLTASMGNVADADGINMATIRYDWYRGTGTSAIATGETYTVDAADLGSTLSVEVSFSDNAGFSESRRSAATAAVAEAAAALTGLSVSVGGTNQITFASGTMSYDVSVAHDVATVDVDATAASGLTATVTTSTTGATVSGNTVTLAPAGETTVIDVEVSGAGFASQTYTVNVARDAVPAAPTVTIADASANEGDDITFTVTLSAAVAGGLTVTPSFTDGTGDGAATEGTDYTANTAGIDFVGTAGETQTFDVATMDDATEEPDETFTVSLAVSGTTETVTATSTATGTIVDNDGVPAMPTGLEITYNEAADGSAASGNIKVTWDDPSPSQHGSSLISMYEVSAKAANLATQTQTVAFADRADGAVFAAANLTLGATYDIEVVAKSAAGDSEAGEATAIPLPIVTIAATAATLAESDVTTTSTLSASIPASMPTDLVVTVSVDENTADVTLTRAGTDPGEAATTLTILAGETATDAEATDDADDNITITVVDDDFDEGNTARADLSDPAVATEIAYDVVTITGTYGPDNRATAPADGIEIEITDDDAAPPAPAPVEVSGETTTTAFAVSWDAVTANPAVEVYEIRWIPAATAEGDAAWGDETTGWEVVAGGVDARRRTVTDLTAGTRYVVQVRAENSVGKGARGSVAVTTPSS